MFYQCCVMQSYCRMLERISTLLAKWCMRFATKPHATGCRRFHTYSGFVNRCLKQ